MVHDGTGRSWNKCYGDDIAIGIVCSNYSYGISLDDRFCLVMYAMVYPGGDPTLQLRLSQSISDE